MGIQTVEYEQNINRKKQDSIYYLYGYENRYDYKKINSNIH